MRWKISYPKHGDKRPRSRFLWFPKTIKGERRWLEYATWEDVFVCGSIGGYWFSAEWTVVSDL
jgi:hypothetical protein